MRFILGEISEVYRTGPGHERNDSSVTTYQLSCLFHVLPQNKGFNLQQLSGEEPFIGKSFRFVAIVWSWSTSGWFVMENAENSNGTNLYQREKGTSWIASCSSPRALWISEVFTSVVKHPFENGLKEHTTKHKNGKHQVPGKQVLTWFKDTGTSIAKNLFAIPQGFPGFTYNRIIYVYKEHPTYPNQTSW